MFFSLGDILHNEYLLLRVVAKILRYILGEFGKSLVVFNKPQAGRILLQKIRILLVEAHQLFYKKTLVVFDVDFKNGIPVLALGDEKISIYHRAGFEQALFHKEGRNVFSRESHFSFF